MKRKSIAIITALVLSVSLVACSTNKTNDTTPSETQTEQIETVNYVLTDFVSGLKDWTVEVNAKNIDFMDGVEYNDEIVKEVTVDDSKVDLTKEGKYDLVYSIVPVDDTISKETVTKKVTVKVVSVEEAQKEADAGKQVATSNNEVKKDSNGKTPVAPKQEKPAETPAKKPAGNNNSNNNTNKPSTGNKPSGNTGNNKPVDNNKPSTGNGNGQGNNNNNQGNNNSGNKEPEKHVHSYNSTVTTQPTHTKAGVKTYTCKCGDSYTESIPATGHNWKDVYKDEWVPPVVEKTPIRTEWYECNGCHKKFSNDDDAAIHDAFECMAGYSLKSKTEYKETVIKEGYYKPVFSHKECDCGARQ